MDISEQELAIRRKLKNDFVHYASRCLKIRTKSGSTENLLLNDAQTYIHQQVEAQRAKTGKVRAVILKGRQQGCSTYVQGRIYWRLTHTKGFRAFILTHEDDATNNLFALANRYHDHCPSVVKPSTAAANAKELRFGAIDSEYKIGTAGNKAVGRSSTVMLFHGSEVAFWPNAQDHISGVMQAIPDGDDTEVFLESTANGIGNFFHKTWQKAEAGQSEYIAIFVPWYWQTEYTKTPPEDFKCTAEELDYQMAYGLNDGQMYWRRVKIEELNDENLFKQEYPATASEAFQVSGQDPYIKPELVLAARKCKTAEAYGPKILGVDPARFGNDRTTICFRQGRVVHWLRSYEKKDTMEVVGLVKKAMDEISADKVFIDIGGLGAGVYDRLIELVDKKKVVSVNSSESPLDAEKYSNKRAEIWGHINGWFRNTPCSVPDSDELQADLCQIRYSYDSNSALKMERKEDMKKRGFRSPDCADALGLTLAQPVIVKDQMPKKTLQRRLGWMSR